jgi:hypothetical protein
MMEMFLEFLFCIIAACLVICVIGLVEFCSRRWLSKGGGR